MPADQMPAAMLPIPAPTASMAISGVESVLLSLSVTVPYAKPTIGQRPEGPVEGVGQRHVQHLSADAERAQVFAERRHQVPRNFGGAIGGRQATDAKRSHDAATETMPKTVSMRSQFPPLSVPRPDGIAAPGKV